jgi:peptidoglycan/LPS O-acetylase OafA/YrhL
LLRLREAKRQDSIDGLRGLAALSVFVHHVWRHQLGSNTTPPMTDFWSVVGTELRLGLLLFFILTGFLLYRSFIRHLHHDTKPDMGRYLRRRAARILPAYYVAVIGAIVLVALADTGSLPPTDQLPLFAVFAQNYSADTFLTVDSPTWTLCIEVGFYLLLPLIVVGLLRVRAGWRFQAAVLAGMVVAGLAWRAVGNAIGGGLVWDNMLPSWLPYFAFCMAVALWLEYGRPKPLSSRRTALILALGTVLVLVNAALLGTLQGSEAMHYVSSLPAGIGFALLTGLALAGTGPALRWMHMSWLIALGIVSYGFYLWHVPILIIQRSIYPHGGFLITFAAALPLAVLAGTLSWRLVEKPALRRATRPPEPRAARPARRTVVVAESTAS